MFIYKIIIFLIGFLIIVNNLLWVYLFVCGLVIELELIVFLIEGILFLCCFVWYLFLK